MRSRTTPWLLAAPVMIAGSLAAHALGYLAFSPASSSAVETGSDLGGSVADRASHGLTTLTPLLLGLVAAFLIVGFCRHVWASGRGRDPKPLGTGWFFVLPPLTLILQEIAERVIHAESFPFNPAHEPAFLAALVLQIPFGFAAYAIARLLLRAADALGRALFARRVTAPVRGGSVLRPPRHTDRRRIEALRSGNSSRSPPLLAT